MKFLPKQLQTEYYCYSPDKSRQQFLVELNAIFNKRILSAFELDGKFISKDEFVLYEREFLSLSKPLMLVTRIQGRIDTQNEKMILNVAIEPSKHSRVFLFVPLLAIAFMLVVIFHDKPEDVMEWWLGTVIWLVIWIGHLFYTQYAKDKLRRKFVEAFSLSNSV